MSSGAGRGSDTATYKNASSAVWVSLLDGYEGVKYSDWDEYGNYRSEPYVVSNYVGDTYHSIENVTGSAYADYILGDEGANTLKGRDGEDHIIGGAGEDTIYGGDHDDVLEGGSSGDEIYGGGGSDTASYQGSNASVTIHLDLGIASGGHATGDTLTAIEDIEGSEFDDYIWGDGKSNTLTGRDGGDALHGEGGIDYLHGGDGADYLWGGAGADEIYGDDQNDHLYGDGGIDLLEGGDGHDVLEGGARGDTLRGGAGLDTASYANSNASVTIHMDLELASGGHADGDTLDSIEHVEGSSHGDFIWGDGQDNTLTGLGGGDRLNGEGGSDLLVGGEGDDVLNGGSHMDVLMGDEDDDMLDGGAGADIIDGGDDVDTVLYRGSGAAVFIDLAAREASGGHANGDTLLNIENVDGSDHDDVITGNEEDNALRGRDGDDTLDGREGGDILDGGDGEDTVLYRLSDTAVTIDLESGVANGGHATGDTLLFVEHVEGSDYGDVISGDEFDNTLKAMTDRTIFSEVTATMCFRAARATTISLAKTTTTR